MGLCAISAKSKTPQLQCFNFGISTVKSAKKEIMKNPIKVMLIIVIILLIASIVFNVIQARRNAEDCNCGGEADAAAAAATVVVTAPTV